MARVTIHTMDGDSHEFDVPPEQEAFYDDLPFTSKNVMITEIRD